MRPLLFLFVLLASSRAWAGDDQRSAPVGMTARIDQLVLPGPELEVKPLADRRAPIVLRIANVYPHGTAFRYDLVYYGLEGGTFDLKDFLQRKDGSATAALPSMRVTIQATLPPGQILPQPLEHQEGPSLGGYRLVLYVGGVLWGGGLLAILLLKRRKKDDAVGMAERPRSLADRLRPLVEQAMAGNLTQVEQAELERMLLAFWRRRLGLHEQKPAVVFALLRQHAEAGPLLRQLEDWLHRPTQNTDVDVAALLRPYGNLPAEDENWEERSEVIVS